MLLVTGVPASEAAECWDEARPFVERALAQSGGHLAAEDVLARVLRREMQLWTACEPDGRIVGVCLTQIVTWPRRRVCRLAMGAAEHGRRDEWMAGLDLVTRWARAQGCERMEVYGRPGWGRLLPHATRRVALEWAI